MEAKEKVLQAMQQNSQPMRPGEIADAAGIDKKDVDKVIKILKDQDLIYSPKRCFYQAK
ncbi:MAG: MarR family transcriptional regulator [Bacteroidales bacterium]|jgi:DNA-binding MarR family transcriptional regulator|nr:MarR family transcriptional regulator [Bacteroidales bacterium]MDP2236113.1 MarR family transcriptional regulator [Bacteroidales bacterium]MDZ4204657.1 MarR family transcriptional regulator [Bacteroidales bacterium]